METQINKRHTRAINGKKETLDTEMEVEEDIAETSKEKSFETIIKELELENAGLKRTVETYRENGPLRMYYALNRKINEMADALNARRLSTIDLKDGGDKTYDRLKSMWKDASELSTTVMELRKVSGATDDEEKDMKRSFDIDEFSKTRSE